MEHNAERLCTCRYSRVANMIEIEVEIDAELPAAEVQGIAEQIDRLEEVAEMQVRPSPKARSNPQTCQAALLFRIAFVPSCSGSSFAWQA